MAQKSIREAQAKQMIIDHWQGPGKPVIHFAEIGPETDLKKLPGKHTWLKGKLVAKVDELFGKRGKLGYVKIAESCTEVCEWIESLRGKTVKIGERKGKLDHFLIEPFIEHKYEYYLAFTAEREKDVIHFSESGGVDVEEQGESIMQISVELNSEHIIAKAILEYTLEN